MNSASVIIPTWNEQDNVQPLVERLDKVLSSRALAYELIFIDDNSTDNTVAVLERLERHYPIRIFTKQGERGKARSLLEGFSYARYNSVVMIDSDLQYPPEAIPEMIDLLERGAHMVLTRRVQHGEGFLRKLSSKIFSGLFIRLLHGINYDVQSGLKAFNSGLLALLPKNPSQWAFDLEFLLNVRASGANIESVDIAFTPRFSGESKVDLLEATIELAGNALALKGKRIRSSAAEVLRRSFGQLLKEPEVEQFSQALAASRGHGFSHKGEIYVHHSDLEHNETAYFVISRRQKLVMLAIGGLIALALWLNWHTSLLILFAVITVIYFGDLLFNLMLVSRSFSRDPAIKISPRALAAAEKKDWPRYTIFCPLYKEWQVVPQFVEAMRALDYPHDKLQVMLLLEEDDIQTIQKVRQLDLPDFVKITVVPHSRPKTKPKAMNYGLSAATGEFLVIYDAEDVPDPLQLKKAVMAFRNSDENVICIQAKLNFYNPTQNLLTRLFTAEYSLWFDLVLTGLQSLNGPIPLGGTSNHFRTEDIKKLNGWDAFNVTEDCDLGLRLFKRGYRTAILESTTMEEANSDWKNWFYQRSRWIKGYIQTYLVHMRRPGEMIRSWREPHIITFQLIVGGKILSMFINPLMWVITLSYFVFRSHVGGFIESFFPSTILYIGVVSFVFGNFLYLYYYMVGCARRGHYDLIKYTLLIPLYWLGMSAAAWKAVYEIIRKPHYWAKTVHGLHLAPVNEPVPESVQVLPEPIVPIPVMAFDLEPEPDPLPMPPIPALPSVGPRVFSHEHSMGRFAGYIALLRSKTASSGGLLVVAMMAANVLNFLFNAVLGRVLTLEDFATVTLFNTILSLMAIALGSLSGAVNYRTAFLVGAGEPETASMFSRFTERGAFWLTLAGSAVWLASVPFLARFFNIQQNSLLFLFTPVITFGALASVSTGFLRGRFLFHWLGRTLIVEALSKLAFAVLFAAMGLHQWVALSIPLSIIVSFLTTYYYARKAVRGESWVGKTDGVIWPRESYEFPRRFFGASVITAISSAAFLNIDVLLAKHYLSPQDAGAYALLSLVGKIVFFFGGLLSTFTTSIVSRHRGAQTDPQQDFLRLFYGTAGFTLIAFALTGLLGRVTVPMLFGAKAAAIVPFLFNYCLAMVFFTLTSAIIGYYVAKRDYVFSWISLGTAAVLITGIVLFHGSIGDFSRVMLVSGVFSLLAVLAWRAVRTNSRFFLRNITDFFDAFAPREAVSGEGKRILIFNWRDTKHVFSGGAETYIHELARRWVDAGHEVTQFCGNDGMSARNETVDGVKIIRRGGFYFVYVWAFVYYLVQFRGRYDIIIDCQNGIPFFTPLYAKEPVYCLLHHVHQEVFHKYLSRPLALIAAFLESAVMPFVYRQTKFITVSTSSWKEMKEIGLGGAGTDVIFPGVDLESLTPGKRSHRPLVVYLGRLKAYKSVDILLKAFQLVAMRLPQARLVIAGAGEEMVNLRNLSEKLSLGDNIEFKGKVTDAEKVSLLQRAWVFVNPSMMEGWGITTIEANACGVPVVAANVPGLRDSVKNPHTGYLVPHGDIEQFADRILHLLNNHDLREAMGEEAVEWASRFDWNTSSDYFLTLISEPALADGESYE